MLSHIKPWRANPHHVTTVAVAVAPGASSASTSYLPARPRMLLPAPARNCGDGPIAAWQSHR